MKEKTIQEIRNMNYSDFCLWVTKNFNDIEYIISYEDFSVIKYKNHYFYYEHEYEGSSEDFYEVKIIAQLNYSVNNDIQKKDSNILHSLFDCDICGEYVYNNGISYLWFKEIK